LTRNLTTTAVHIGTAYFEKLDRTGVGAIRADLARISEAHGGRDLFLLCYEDTGEYFLRQGEDEAQASSTSLIRSERPYGRCGRTRKPLGGPSSLVV